MNRNNDNINVTIRLASLNDAPDIAKIHSRSWEAAYHAILPTEYIKKQCEKRPEQWKHILSFENTSHYVIEKDGKAAGMFSV
ncbi:hypothetical protein SDC9_103463 [bioreactor metagenome]|uniref:N-acetyltransferase domain-containing protein n=1 Tax=bioreactor metagenome TaxID=1076179 RepID=A0A645B4K4_9ZZZZ|nr:hypothetical protein [Oscillospiraceae bacterium]